MSLECEILTRENVTLTGTIKFTGGGWSGSYSHLGYRCGSASTTSQYIEVYVNDTNHDWSWPTYCVRVGDPFALQAGNIYDLRGPSVRGAEANSFSISSYTPTALLKTAYSYLP